METSLTNIEILKMLLSEAYKSKYALNESLKEKYGTKKANYPTLRRRIDDLKIDGLIEIEEGKKKNGKQDKRGTQNIGLSFKGLVYLIIKSDLDETESRMIVNKIYSKKHFSKLKLSGNNSIK
jgi:hypothetical protein